MQLKEREKEILRLLLHRNREAPGRHSCFIIRLHFLQQNQLQHL
jgi:hypothetical protein